MDIIVEIDENEMWSAIFGSAFVSFGTHWYEVEYLEGDWDKIGKVRLVIQDEVDGSLTEAVVGLEEVARALPIANKQVYMDLFDFDSYDAICGDAVLQVCVLGKVVYG